MKSQPTLLCSKCEKNLKKRKFTIKRKKRVQRKCAVKCVNTWQNVATAIHWLVNKSVTIPFYIQANTDFYNSKANFSVRNSNNHPYNKSFETSEHNIINIEQVMKFGWDGCRILKNLTLDGAIEYFYSNTNRASITEPSQKYRKGEKISSSFFKSYMKFSARMNIISFSRKI